MSIQTDPIHQDDLLETLKEYGNSFIDEESRIISLDYFKELFIYKYGGFFSDWTVWVELGLAYNEIHCKNISGMRFVFPIITKKTGQRSSKSKREIGSQIKH